MDRRSFRFWDVSNRMGAIIRRIYASVPLGLRFRFMASARAGPRLPDTHGLGEEEGAPRSQQVGRVLPPPPGRVGTRRLEYLDRLAREDWIPGGASGSPAEQGPDLGPERFGPCQDPRDCALPRAGSDKRKGKQESDPGLAN